MKTILTIAGFDPSSGAGMTADLAVIGAHGFFGMSAITALTVQSTLGVRAVHPVAAEVLAATLATLVEDIRPDGIKIGMLRLVKWVTPNLAELAVLSGRDVATEEQMENAAVWMADEWCDLGVVATGGHGAAANDFWVEPGGKAGGWEMAGKIESRSTHGTGCAFSTALVCALVDGLNERHAIGRAKRFVEEGIRRAPEVGHGRGPMDLLWQLRREESGATLR
jgi:hydroxymethylpyrimidine/phosphomethylpyrimidine kinase